MPVSQWYGIVEFNVEWDVKLYYTLPYTILLYYTIPYHWDTGIRWVKRAVATLPQVNLEHLVVEEKVGRSVVKV